MEGVQASEVSNSPGRIPLSSNARRKAPRRCGSCKWRAGQLRGLGVYADLLSLHRRPSLGDPLTCPIDFRRLKETRFSISFELPWRLTENRQQRGASTPSPTLGAGAEKGAPSSHSCGSLANRLARPSALDQPCPICDDPRSPEHETTLPGRRRVLRVSRRRLSLWDRASSRKGLACWRDERGEREAGGPVQGSGELGRDSLR
jgi:hypothetical protein